MATLLHLASKHGIRYFVSGLNHTTEGILPVSWSYGHADWRYIRKIHAQFGARPIKAFPYYGLIRRMYTILTGRPRIVCLLDCEDYDKQSAMDIITRELGWRYYGGKHYESIYTRFFQSYILPVKFGIDKRKAHLSSLILAGQMTRSDALAQLEAPTYPEALMKEDKAYVIKKLGLTEGEFECLMDLPLKSFRDYPSYYPLLNRISKFIGYAKKRGLIPRVGGM